MAPHAVIEGLQARYSSAAPNLQQVRRDDPALKLTGNMITVNTGHGGNGGAPFETRVHATRPGEFVIDMDGEEGTGYYVLGFDILDNKTARIMCMVNREFGTYEEANHYAQSCGPSYLAFVVSRDYNAELQRGW